jgi:hypothetical protein
LQFSFVTLEEDPRMAPTSTTSTSSSNTSTALAPSEVTVDVGTTKVELNHDDDDCCSDVDSLRQRCGSLRRENEMLRTELEEERASRRLADDAAKAELSTGILETLQGEFACSICSEVSPS